MDFSKFTNYDDSKCCKQPPTHTRVFFVVLEWGSRLRKKVYWGYLKEGEENRCFNCLLPSFIPNPWIKSLLDYKAEDAIQHHVESQYAFSVVIPIPMVWFWLVAPKVRRPAWWLAELPQIDLECRVTKKLLITHREASSMQKIPTGTGQSMQLSSSATIAQHFTSLRMHWVTSPSSNVCRLHAVTRC